MHRSRALVLFAATGAASRSPISKLCSYLSRIDRVRMSRMWRHRKRTQISSRHCLLRPQWHGGQPGQRVDDTLLCAHCQRCALSTPAQQCERQHHVRNTVRPRPPLHRSGGDLLRSRLVASQDSRTRPVGRTRRYSRSTGAAGSTGSRAGGARASATLRAQ